MTLSGNSGYNKHSEYTTVSSGIAAKATEQSCGMLVAV